MILVLKQDQTLTEKYQLTMNQTIPYLPGLSPVAGKALCTRFDGGRLSSDGGVLLLRGIEHGLGLGGLLASCLRDESDPSSTRHSLADMIRARIMSARLCLVLEGSLSSRRHDANNPPRPRPCSIPRNNKTPPSEDSRPPSNRVHKALPATGDKPGR